jgi:hypothetical protein
MSTDTPGNPASRELGYCPCCGYQTLPQGKPGSYDVCSVCHWTDDPTQFRDPEFVSDANHVSLTEARENFRSHGACDAAFVEKTTDPDGLGRDPNWPY